MKLHITQFAWVLAFMLPTSYTRPCQGASCHRRFIFVSNHLPIRATKREETGGWEFEWDEDALIYQAQAC